MKKMQCDSIVHINKIIKYTDGHYTRKYIINIIILIITQYIKIWKQCAIVKSVCSVNVLQ